MKTCTFIFTLLFLTLIAVPIHAAETAADLLRKGLFEEEANQNLEAAIKAYQAIVDQADEQRKIAATAVFRLAESYRKLGKTNEAAAQYERMLRDYSEQTNLVTLSQSHLATMRPPTPTPRVDPLAAGTAPDPALTKLLEEEIKLADLQLTVAQKKFENGKANRGEITRARNELLSVKRKLPENLPVAQQRALIEEQIKLVEELLKEMRQQIAVGAAPPLDEVPLKRELLGLQRELATVSSAGVPKGTADSSAAPAQLAAQLAAIESLKNNPEDQGRAVYAIFPDEDLKRMLLNVPGLREQEATLRANPNAKLTSWRLALAPWGPGSDLKGPPNLAQAQEEYQRQLSFITQRVDFILGVQKARLRVLQTMSGQARSESTTERTQQTPLLSTDEEKEIVRIKAMVANSPDLLNRPGDKGLTPLQTAALNGHLVVAKVLINSGADLQRRSRQGQTALHYAAFAGHKAMVELLANAGADVNATDDYNAAALHYAAINGSKAVAEVLLAHKADPNINGKRVNGVVVFGSKTIEFPGGTPLHIAARGYPALAELLITKGADVNATDAMETTPLQWAASSGEEKNMELLLAKGADVNHRDRAGSTALHGAVTSQRAKAAEILLENGADINGIGAAYGTSLQLALAQKPPETSIVRVLLNHKPDLEVKSADGFTPLAQAVNLGELKITELLLDAGANPNSVLRDGTTALFNAVSNGPEITELLLKHGANPNAVGPSGTTPLFNALLDSRVTKVLLQHGANPNVLDESGKSPLDFLEQSRASSRLGRGFIIPGAAAAPRTSQNQSADGFVDSAELLRKAGANENLAILSAISLGRNKTDLRIPHFRKGTNSLNRFTLFEIIADHYMPLVARRGAPTWDSSVMPFPDFDRISIRRVAPDDKNLPQELSLDAALSSGDCSKDRWLEWGELVEIPERDHPVTEEWRGLADFERKALRKCLERHVEIVVKGQTNRIALVPRGTFFSTPGSFGGRQPPDMVRTDSGNMTIANFWAGQVMQISKLVRTSSDLTRVKVTRTEAETKKVQELVMNLEGISEREGPPAANDLWLRDGDVIEIPDKE